MTRAYKPKGLQSFVGSEQFYGAKLGTCGVLYSIVKSILVVKPLQDDRDLLNGVLQTLNFLINKIIAGDGLLARGRFFKRLTVDWCGGSPGAIPLLTLAVQLFPWMSERLLETAELVGERLWKEGLLLKGNSLCHGIAGNGYLLHCLYREYMRLTIDERSKSRTSELMARATLW